MKREEDKRKEKNGNMKKRQKVIEIWRRKRKQEYVVKGEEKVRKRVRRKEDKKERKGRVIFWNVVRLRYKDRDFWKGIR